MAKLSPEELRSRLRFDSNIMQQVKSPLVTIRAFGSMNNKLQEGLASAERYYEVLSEKPAVVILDPDCNSIFGRQRHQCVPLQLVVCASREKIKEPGHYTFWDYLRSSNVEKNRGWRIDLMMGTRPMMERLEKIWIDKEPRLKERPSDHTFLAATFR